MPLASTGGYSIGNKPMQTLGAARTPIGAAYPAGGMQPRSTAAPQPAGGGYYTGPTGTSTIGNMTYDPATGNVGSAGVGHNFDVDQDQQRRDRDKQDYADKLAIDSRYGGPTAGGTTQPYGGSSGGGGGAGGAGGGLDVSEIMGVLDKLKPEPPPQREQAPGLLAREAAPGAISSPSAKSQGFARAKDNAGRVANTALKSLRSEMVSRGIEGSGVEGQLTGNILGETARGVADASFANERQAEEQSWQAAQQGYQGAINQRGQDLGLQTAGFGGNVTQRGQDINAQPNMLQLAPTILSMLGRSRY